MSNLFERARELGEWLRYEAWRQCACVRGALSRLDCVRCCGTGFVVNSAMKSRAETLESLLAENERLRSEREWRPIETTPWECVPILLWKESTKEHYVAARIGGQHGPGWCTPDGYEIFRATNWQPLPSPPNAEPESDPGLPAGSSPAEVAERCAQIAEGCEQVETQPAHIIAAAIRQRFCK